ncbi:MAG: hypothetical protein R3Y43_03755 [Alphaproteobacteria bacterium]
MPNGGTPRATSPTISDLIGTLKRFTNKKVGFNIFQRSFYYRIICDDECLPIAQYILENPYHWHKDEYYKGDKNEL